MEPQRVVSREYKVMLRPKLFTGAEHAVLEKAHALWKDVVEKIGDVVVHVGGDLSGTKPPRLISFFDTPARRLDEAHYIFRERRPTDGSKREVTLKFRHPDRFFAQARDMKPRSAAKQKSKFEEDIKGPFVSLHSFSTTVEVEDAAKFAKLGDVVELFPDLGEKLPRADKNEPLRLVNDFTAREVVVEGAKAQMGKTPEVDAEWALIVWYDERGRKETPIAVELSFRYGDKSEEYGGGLTRRASDVFNLIQTGLKRWVDPKPRTKTAVAFQ